MNEVILPLDSNSYYHNKMAAFQELQEALQIRSVNDELLEYLASSLNWLLHYTSKYNIILPEKDRIYEVLERAMAIASKLPSNIPTSDEIYSKIIQTDPTISCQIPKNSVILVG